MKNPQPEEKDKRWSPWRLPNLKQFARDPRDWPKFIQTSSKSMVHDMFASDAHRLTLLHTMLASNLRAGMSQILTSPMAYRNELQEPLRPPTFSSADINSRADGPTTGTGRYKRGLFIPTAWRSIYARDIYHQDTDTNWNRV